MEFKFRIGDRVRIIKDTWDVGLDGRVATIVQLRPKSSHCQIAVDGWNGGHCGSLCDNITTNRWNIEKKDIELLEEDEDPIIGVKSLLPHDAKERKEIPLASGVMDYFTAALIEVAKVSFKGNQQHNPGQPLHWAQEKSTDHADTLLRHFAERGTIDSDGTRHSAKLAWRALALLQMELQAEGYPKARGAK